MKKTLLFLMAALGCYAGHAQNNSNSSASETDATEIESTESTEGKSQESAVVKNGFYLSPHLGGGISQVRPAINESLGVAQGISQSGIFCYNAEIGIEYRFRNLRIHSGIQYLTSGFQLNNLGWTSDPALPYLYNGNDKFQMTYSHLAVPLQIGYSIFPQKKLSLVPYLGIIASYNTGAKSITTLTNQDGSNTTTTKTSWSKKDFDAAYQRISIWGTCALYLEYKATQKISIFGGPSAKYMINNFGKTDPIVPYNEREQRNQTVTIDIGLNIKL